MRTRMKQALSALAFLWLASGVHAADRVWTGGGGDALWSNPANWASGTPVAGDTLVFGASSVRDTTNDLEAGTAFTGITFPAGSGGKYTLNGNALTLEGAITTFSGYTPEIALPLILGTDCQCLGSNGTLAISGAISGPGGLRFEGNTASGVTFALSGDNSFEGPVVVTNRARLVVSSPSALGSPAAGTTVYGPNETWLEISGGTTLGEPLTLLGSDGAPNYHPCLKSTSGTNTLSAPIYSTSLGFRMRVYADKLILRGGVISPDTTGTFTFETSTGTEIVVTNRPLFLGNGAGLYTSYGGRVVLAESGNTYAVLHAYAGSTVLATAPNALAPYGVVRCGISWWDKDTSLFDLNGLCQTVGPLESYALPSGVHVITSAVPTVLTVVQRYNSTFRGDIAGAVSLYKTGTYTLTLTNALPMTTTGRVTVASGTLALGNAAGSVGGFGAVPAVRVLPGGTLALNNGAGLPDTSEINVFTGGVLTNGKIDVRTGVTETVARFYIDGAQQAAGTWGRTGSGATHINDAFFAGTGLLEVTEDPAAAYTDAVWDQGGADTLMSTAANWTGDTLPTFTGNERAVFGTGAGPAGVDAAVSFYKMVINWPSSDFHFDNIGGGSLTLGRGGIEIPGPASTRYNRIRVPVTLADDQFITLTNGYVFFEQPVSDGGNGFGLTVCNPSRGNAAVIPQNQNTYSGKTVLKNRSIVYIRGSGDVLGSTAGDTLVENGSYLYIDTTTNTIGLTIAEPLVLDGDATLSYGGTLQNYKGTNVLTGPISGLNNSVRIRTSAVGATLDITGGITADATGGSCILATDSGGTITVREKPVYANAFYANGKSLGGMVVIAATGNVTRTCYMNANVRLGAQEAFEYLGNLILGNDGRIANVDLNGFGLTVRRALSTHLNSTNSVIFSAVPATLTVDQTVDTTYGGSFSGAVSLIKRGAGTLTLTNELDRSTTTSGGVTVKCGTLKVAGDYGSLGPACTNITVEGSGTLALASESASMLSDDATVRLSPASAGSAKISLAEGVDETVGWLFCGGEPMYPGTYGAAGSGAQYTDDTRFAGTGVLRVLHGKAKGTIISLY